VGRLSTEAAPATTMVAARFDARAQPRSSDAALAIAAPLGGAVYLLDATLRPEFQTLALRTRGGTAGRREWFVDGTSIGTSGANGALHWPLARGTHEVTVRDEAGQTALAHFVVR